MTVYRCSSRKGCRPTARSWQGQRGPGSGRGIKDAGRLAGRFAAAVVAAALAFAVRASAAELSPYALVADALPANPAARPGHVFVLSAGPVSAEVASSEWTVRQLQAFFEAISDESRNLPTLENREDLRLAGLGRASVSVLGFDVTYAPVVVSAVGSIEPDFVKLVEYIGSLPSDGNALPQAPDTAITVRDTSVQLAVWQDVSVRAALGIPFIPRLLGLSRFVVGGAIHWLQGKQYMNVTATAALDPQTMQGSDPSQLEQNHAQVQRLSSQSGSGTAYDVGLVVGLRRWLTLEAAYVGAGQLTWTEVERETDSFDGDRLSQNQNPFVDSPPEKTDDVRYVLPASALVALRVRPVGPVELTAGYARIGVNRPGETLTRLNGEVGLNLALVQAALGVVSYDQEPSQVYAQLRLGLGATGVTVRVVNLQALSNLMDQRALGASAMVTLGF